MLWKMIIFLAGTIFGIYLGNKKLRHRVNRALSALSHKDEDDELYEDED